MKKWLALFIIIVSILTIGCNKDKDNKKGHIKPNFTLNALGGDGFVSKNIPLEVLFKIENLKADKPYEIYWDFGDKSTVIKNNSLEQTHKYEKQGKYTVTVKLLDKDFISETKTPEQQIIRKIEVSVKSKSDIVTQVSEINIISIAQKETKFIDATFINLGSEPTTSSSSAKVYFSLDKELSEDDFLVGETEIEPLEAGGATLKNIPIQLKDNIPAGEYWIIIHADSDNVYNEENEKNNITIADLSVEVLGIDSNLPDIMFKEVKLPDFFISNENFKISASIKNQGEAPSLPFTYKLVLSKNDTLETEKDKSDDIALYSNFVGDSLQHDESVVIEAIGRIEKSGEYYLFLVIDENNDLIESDETNNIYKIEKIKVLDSIPGVDILPFKVGINPPNNIPKGKILTVSYNVRNRGDKPALKSNTRIFISTDEILDKKDRLLTLENNDTGKLPAIAPESKLIMENKVKIPDVDDFTTGEYYIIVEVNYDDGNGRPIEEISYSNNYKSSAKFEVKNAQTECAYDIQIKNVTINPKPAFQGSYFELNFDIENLGTEEVGSFVTDIYSGKQGVKLDDENNKLLKKNYNISRLPSKQTVHKSVRIMIENDKVLSENHCILIKSDKSNRIAECDEENNNVQYCFDIIPRGQNNDIIVSEVKVSDTNKDLKADDKLMIEFTAKNTGTTNTATFRCQAYFSPDDKFSKENDFKTDEYYEILNIKGGESKTVTDYEVTIPKNMGNRPEHLFIDCDSTFLVPEINEDNNFKMYDGTIKIKGSDSGCDADNYELNNLSNQASLISNLNNRVLANICDQDIDWFKFDLKKTHRFKITLNQNIGTKNIDLVLYKLKKDNTLEEIQASKLKNKSDEIEIDIVKDEDEGIYLLKAYPEDYDKMTDSDYNISLSYSEIGGSGVDLVIKTVDSSEFTSINTGKNFKLGLTVENLKNDESGEFTVGVYLSKNSLVNKDDTILKLATSESIGFLKTKDFDLSLRLEDDLPTGLYYLIVKIDPENKITETNEKNNKFAKQILVNFKSECELDSLEPNRSNSDNNEPVLGKVISNGYFNNLKLCGNDDDVYLVYLRKDSEFKAYAYFDDKVGDINMKLYPPSYGDNKDDRKAKASSTSRENKEKIEYKAEKTGFYYLHVFHGEKKPNNAQTYGMHISGISDGYDLINNNIRLVSKTLKTGRQAEFEFNLYSESTKDITTPVKYKVYFSKTPFLDVNNDTLVLDKEISEILVREIISEKFNITIPYGLETGKYYLISKIDSENAINEFDEENNKQILPISISGICKRDKYESNNVPKEADDNDSEILLGEKISGLTLCSNDDDYYRITFSTADIGKNVFIKAYFKHNQGNLNLKLYDSDDETKEPVAEASTQTDDEYINYTIKKAGIHFILVTGVDGASNSYELEAKIVDCSGINCGSNGACDYNSQGDTYCKCDDGYTGSACDSCDTNYHLENGKCIKNDSCQIGSCKESKKTKCSIVNYKVHCSCDSSDYKEDSQGKCIFDCSSVENAQVNAGNNGCECKNGFHKDEHDKCVSD